MARGNGDEGPHPVDRHVGRRVCEKRIDLGYNQSDLGRALGVTFQQIQKYEKGANRISASRLWDISRFFNIDSGFFFEGLADAEEGAEAGNAEPVHAVRRQSLEIARAAPQLSLRQQKLALDLMRALADRPEPELA